MGVNMGKLTLPVMGLPFQVVVSLPFTLLSFNNGDENNHLDFYNAFQETQRCFT